MDKEKKDRINKRKIAYVYLMHRMFEGNPVMMLKILGSNGITVEDLQEWDSDYKDAVYQTIQEEDAKGVNLKDKDNDVPSIKHIKEEVLRRVDKLINVTEDPARLAQVYKILSEFETADDKKEKSVLDAINDSIKPLTPKKSNSVTMLDRMRQENKIMDPGKRGRGRPKKVQSEPDDSQIVNNVQPDETGEEEE